MNQYFTNRWLNNFEIKIKIETQKILTCPLAKDFQTRLLLLTFSLYVLTLSSAGCVKKQQQQPIYFFMFCYILLRFNRSFVLFCGSVAQLLIKYSAQTGGRCGSSKCCGWCSWPCRPGEPTCTIQWLGCLAGPAHAIGSGPRLFACLISPWRPLLRLPCWHGFNCQILNGHYPTGLPTPAARRTLP
jgi:hypothetical protein